MEHPVTNSMGIYTGKQGSTLIIILRRKLDLTTDGLAPSRFTAIDVGDALLNRDVLSSESTLSGLCAYLVCQVNDDLDQGIS